MKLLVFSPYYPPHIGGLESHSDEFNLHLAKQGVEITVFTPQLPFNAPREAIVHNNVRVLRFPAWEPIHNYPLPKYWPFFWTSEFFKMFRSLSNESPDIIVSRTRFFASSLLALVYAKWRHIPLLHIEHGSDYVKFNGRFKTILGKLYDHTFGWLVLRFADSLVANSKASAAFVKKISRRDCAVIYRGVETTAILEIKPNLQLRDIHAGKVIIGFVGRLIDGKGVIDLVKALSKIKREDFFCFIIGDGPERKRLESIVKMSALTEKIKFFGHLAHNEAIAILKVCDIVVNPSYTEGLPTSVIEAALCQKAIIATDVGGTKEIVTDTREALLYRPKNIPQLTQKLEELINNTDHRAALGLTAYQHVKTVFEWEKSTQEYMKILQKLSKRS